MASFSSCEAWGGSRRNVFDLDHGRSANHGGGGPHFVNVSFSRLEERTDKNFVGAWVILDWQLKQLTVARPRAFCCHLLPVSLGLELFALSLTGENKARRIFWKTLK
jgi:hypothetical protein